MANPLLHIKDSYYFEVPKALWPVKYTDKSQFPDVWVRLDDEFQTWEADRLAEKLEVINQVNLLEKKMPSKHDLLHDYEHWKHADHANHGKHFSAFLEKQADDLYAKYEKSLKPKDGKKEAPSEAGFKTYLLSTKPDFGWFANQWIDKEWRATWEKAKDEAGDVALFKKEAKDVVWSKSKLDAYNFHLSGRILIPQPPNVKLRNFYESESPFALSKYMILELVAAFIICFYFIRLANRIRNGDTPKGPIWNMLEGVLVFLRDQVVRPAIGDHHHDEHDHAPAPAHGHDDRTEHAHGAHATAAVATHGHDAHGHKPHGHAAAKVHTHAADKYVPLLWTIFCFVLLCNLLGMIPCLGAPTSSWAVTLAMAVVVFASVTYFGMREFGFFGFFANQVPSMGLPVALAIPLVPMIFLIEMLGLFIKHAVLSVRLLANMVAGHLVVLGLMGAVVTLEMAMSQSWYVGAPVVAVGSTLFNLLEVLVAFLQAYIFTFLSALFIAAAVHKH